MSMNPLKQGALTTNATGIGIVSRKMVRERAVELASCDGRAAQAVSKSDWDQAKREMTGEPDVDPKDKILESAPESERWDPVHGSTGQKIPPSPGEDEDEEGRSDKERLVAEGIAQADHDRTRQAAQTRSDQAS